MRKVPVIYLEQFVFQMLGGDEKPENWRYSQEDWMKTRKCYLKAK